MPKPQNPRKLRKTIGLTVVSA